MYIVPLHPDPVPTRTAGSGQIAALKRRVRASDELLRVLAELSFGPPSDRDSNPLPLLYVEAPQ